MGPISSLIEIVRAGIDLARGMIAKGDIIERDLTIEDIKKGMDSGSLNIGDKITCVGTLSKFLPFVNLRNFVENMTLPHSMIQCTCRLDSIMNTYCATLYMPDQTKATSTTYPKTGYRITERSPNPCIPVLYSKIPETISDKSLKLANYKTGDMPELTCEIRELPDDWKRIIAPMDPFCYIDTHGSLRPFCLKVINVKPYGTILDEFKIDVWVAGHFGKKTFEKLSTSKEPLHIILKFTTERDLTAESLNTFVIKDKDNRFREKLVHAHAFYGRAFIVGLGDVNVLNPKVLGLAREAVPELVKIEGIPHGKFLVDFQYDQIDKISRQSFSNII